MKPICIHLLGRLAVEREGEMITRFPTYKTGALLALLAWRRGEMLSREQVVDMFWPDADLEAGRQSLRTALTAIRRLLDGGGKDASLITADHWWIGLNAAVNTDVAQLNETARQMQRLHAPQQRVLLLKEAQKIYAGELLPALYEEWILGAREQCAAQMRQMLLQGADDFESLGDLAEAAQTLQQVIALDVLDAELHLRLMRLYSDMHRPDKVQQQYNALLDVINRFELPALSEEQNNRIFRLLNASSAEESAPASTLPPTFTLFFGREAELQKLEGWLHPQGGAVLVSVTGPGGAGKTRLAIEAARRFSPLFNGEVYFVSLEKADAPASILRLTADALHIPVHPFDNLKQRLLKALSSRPLLLILDNLEHLQEDFPAEISLLIMEIAGAGQRLRCLVTSRRRLQVTGEHLLPLSHLSFPPEDAPEEDLLQYDAVQLFVNRAQAVSPELPLGEGQMLAVSRLCRQLEGWPLALEMAAGWSSLLTPEQIAHRFQNVLLAEAPPASQSDRHATMQQVVQWSFSLLEGRLQRILVRMAVFQGGCTVDAIAAVVLKEEEEKAEEKALHSLHALCDRSLISLSRGCDSMRFQLPAPIRSYARHRLESDAAECILLQQAHLEYYAKLAEKANTLLHGTEGVQWKNRLQEENLNFQRALEFVMQQQTGAAGSLVLALAHYWEINGNWSEGLQWIERALVLTETGQNAQTRASLCCHAAMLCMRLGKLNQAEAYLHASEEGEVEEHAARLEAQRLLIRARIADRRGDLAAAEQILQKALERLKENSSPVRAECLNLMGVICYHKGEYARAAEYYQQALQHWQAAGYERGTASVLINLGLLDWLQQDLQSAEVRFQSALKILEKYQDRQSLQSCLLNLGNLAAERGEYAETERRYEQSRKIAESIGDRMGAAAALNNMGIALLRQQEYGRAMLAIEQALHLYREINNWPGIGLALFNTGVIALETANLSLAQSRLAEALVIQQERGDRRGTAETCEAAARLLFAMGSREAAGKMLGCARRLRSELNIPVPLPEKEKQAALLQALQQEFDAEQLQHLITEGELLEPEEAFELLNR